MTDPAPGADGNKTTERGSQDTSSITEDPPTSPVATVPGDPAAAEDVAERHGHDGTGAGNDGATDATEDTEGESDEDEEDEDEDEDDEPRLKYARLTQNLAGVYKNADATSSFLVAGDKMVWTPAVYQHDLSPLSNFAHRSSELTTEILYVLDTVDPC